MKCASSALVVAKDWTVAPGEGHDFPKHVLRESMARRTLLPGRSTPNVRCTSRWSHFGPII